MVPIALVADAIRRAEARADIGRRVVAGARVGDVDGIRDALRAGLLEPDIDLLPAGAGRMDGAAEPLRAGRWIPIASHEGSLLALTPPGSFVGMELAIATRSTASASRWAGMTTSAAV
jgi:hypothetical protein